MILYSDVNICTGLFRKNNNKTKKNEFLEYMILKIIQGHMKSVAQIIIYIFPRTKLKIF